MTSFASAVATLVLAAGLGSPNALLDECPCPGLEGRDTCPLVVFDADLGPIYANSHRRLDPVLDLAREDAIDALPAPKESEFALPENQCYSEEYAAELDAYFDYPEFEDAYPEEAAQLEEESTAEYDYPEYFDYEFDAQFEAYESPSAYENESDKAADKAAARPELDSAVEAEFEAYTQDVAEDEIDYDFYDYHADFPYDYDPGFEARANNDDADYAEVEKFADAIEDEIVVEELDEAADPEIYEYDFSDSDFSDSDLTLKEEEVEAESAEAKETQVTETKAHREKARVNTIADAVCGAAISQAKQAEDLLLDDITSHEGASVCCPLQPAAPLMSAEGVPTWDAQYRSLFSGELTLEAAVHDDLFAAPLAKGRQNVVAFLPAASKPASKLPRHAVLIIREFVSTAIFEVEGIVYDAQEQISALPWDDFQAEMDHQIRTLEERELDAMLAREDRLEDEVARLDVLFDGISLSCEQAAAAYNSKIVKEQRRQVLLGVSQLLDTASRMMNEASQDVARIAGESIQR